MVDNLKKEVKGHGSIRKVKGGAVGVLSLSAALIAAVASGSHVSADESKPTDVAGATPTVTEVAKDAGVTSAEVTKPVEAPQAGNGVSSEAPKTEAPTVEAPKEEAPKAETDGAKKEEAPKTNAEGKEGAKEETPKADAEGTKETPDTPKGQVVPEAPKDTATTKYTKAESKEFDQAVKHATDKGVAVEKSKEVTVHDTEASAQLDLKTQTGLLNNATAVQELADATVKADKEHLKEAGIKVTEGKKQVFDNPEELTKFVEAQTKRVDKEVQTKKEIDMALAKAKKDLEDAGIVVEEGKLRTEKGVEEAKTALAGIQHEVEESLRVKAELSEKYNNLQATIAKNGFKFKEGEKVVYDDAKSALEGLNKQIEEVNKLVQERDRLEASIQAKVKEAESKGITVKRDKYVAYKTVADADKAVTGQLNQLTALVAKVDEAQKEVEALNKEVGAIGLQAKPVDTATANKVHTVAEWETTYKSHTDMVKQAIQNQKQATETFNNLVKEYSVKGINVKVEGENIVKNGDLAKETDSLKAQLEAAYNKKVAQDKAYNDAVEAWKKTVAEGKAKVENDYQTALKAFNDRVAAVQKENEAIRQQNDKVNSNFTNALATLESTSTAKAGQGGTYVQTLKGVSKASTSTSTSKETRVKPRSFLIAFDASGSVAGGTKPELVNSFVPLLQAMKDNEEAQIGFYDINRDTSYFTGGKGDPTRYMTKMMSKAEVQKLYDTYKSMAHGTKWLDAINKAGLGMDYTGIQPGADKRYAFEDVFEASRNKKNSVAVMQFTDGWEDDETIDTSFADYAKKNASTFMSVVYGGGRSVEEMKRVGHPNIFQFNDLKAKDGFAGSPEETKRVVEQIKQTTEVVETVTSTSSSSTGKVTITPQDGVSFVSAELISPSGKKQALEVKNNAVNFSGVLSEAGEYHVNYTFKANKNIDSAVTGTFEVTNAGSEGKGNGVATFTTKAPTSTQKENTVAPLVVDHVLDYSSSYSGKLKDSLRLSKKIIEANSPESKHIIQTYPQNYAMTYEANVGDNIGTRGVSSKLLTKQEALGLIDKLLAINAPSEKNPTYNSYGDYFKGVADAFGNLRYKDSTAPKDKGDYQMLPFEDIVNKLVKPTDTVSVIQYTDGWMYGNDSNGRFTPGTEEQIDKTFADWAKKRAKTFMSVVNRNKVTNEDTNSEQSLKQMREVGHPNIYDLTGKDPKVAETEIIKQFLETATEKVKTTKGEDQTVKATIGGSGVQVTKATLKGGKVSKELPIKDGKVEFTEKLSDGTYNIEFEATGTGNLTTTITVDGKQVVNGTTVVKGGVSGSTTKDTKTDTLKAVKKGNTTPEKPLPTDKPEKVPYKAPKAPEKGEFKEPEAPKAPEKVSVTVKRPVGAVKSAYVPKVETSVDKVTFEGEVKPVTFKHVLDNVTFETEVSDVQAKVTTHDVYVKHDVPAPIAPAKVEPAKAAPKYVTPEVKSLPNTGTKDSNMGLAAASLVGIAGLLGLAKGKKKES